MHKKLPLLTLLTLIVLPSCSTKNANVTKAYLNHKYMLVRAGDLHGLPPTSNEVLNRNEGFTSYIDLFDKADSYINFQCKGTTYEDFYCEASFKLVNKSGEVVMEKESFICQYTGGQSGMVIYDDEETKNMLGIIYVYTPYWCRWQLEYDVDDSGNKTLLTFEFWISKFNPLPDFLTPNNE